MLGSCINSCLYVNQHALNQHVFLAPCPDCRVQDCKSGMVPYQFKSGSSIWARDSQLDHKLLEDLGPYLLWTMKETSTWRRGERVRTNERKKDPRLLPLHLATYTQVGSWIENYSRICYVRILQPPMYIVHTSFLALIRRPLSRVVLNLFRSGTASLESMLLQGFEAR